MDKINNGGFVLDGGILNFTDYDRIKVSGFL